MKRYCGKSRTDYHEWLKDEWRRGHKEINFCLKFQVEIVNRERCPTYGGLNLPVLCQKIG